MKKILTSVILSIFLFGCAKDIIEHRYSMKKYSDSEIKVCVDEQILLIPADKEEQNYYDTIDGTHYQISQNPDDFREPSIVDYDFCLPQDKRIRNYSTKKIKDIEVCYERISEIELPMSYCLPDTNVNVNVSTHVYN